MRTPLFVLFLFVMLGIHPLPTQAQTYLMNTSTVVTCSGTFLDPGGGGDYPLGNTSTMTFTPATVGQFCSINFTSFDVQQDWDVLYAYDGNSVAAPLIGTFSGTTSPGMVTASTANATGSLTFKFVSNWWATGPEPGWTATISCTATGAAPRYAMKNGATYTVCSGTFYDSGGATHSYTWSENSTMSFCPGTAGNGIRLAFSPIDLEQDWDLLKIYDGPTINSPLIAGFGNSDNVILPAQTITASTANTTGCLTAQFVSDGWWQNSGWSAAISCVPKTTPQYGVSTDTIYACNGIFTDNGGPNAPYMDFSNDKFTICPSSAATPYVNVTFSNLDLWTGFDFLKVYDGTSIASPMIGSYTGIISPFMVSAANPSGCLTFEFTSDLWTQRAGWSANIGCSGLIALPVDWLQFTAHRVQQNVQLDWTTASEAGAARFVVERHNGSGFDSLGTVAAAGFSSHSNSYRFVDTAPLDGWNYYRLEEVDWNGQRHTSPVAAVAPADGDADVQLQYEQNGAAQLLFEHLQDDQLSVMIYDGSGRQVETFNTAPGSAHERKSLDFPALAQGFYLIQVSGHDGFARTLRYVKRSTL